MALLSPIDLTGSSVVGTNYVDALINLSTQLMLAAKKADTQVPAGTLSYNISTPTQNGKGQLRVVASIPYNSSYDAVAKAWTEEIVDPLAAHYPYTAGGDLTDFASGMAAFVHLANHIANSEPLFDDDLVTRKPNTVLYQKTEDTKRIGIDCTFGFTVAIDSTTGKPSFTFLDHLAIADQLGLGASL
jgi:hypothetical protein